MKVLVFGKPPYIQREAWAEMKADILQQLKLGDGILLIDERQSYKGTIELSEKDCKQYGVIFVKE